MAVSRSDKEKFDNTCRIAGCDSMAHWEPHLKLWYRGLDGRPIPLEMKATAVVCDNHKRRFVELIMSDKNKEMIADQIIKQNLGAPDFSSMTIEFKPIQRPKTVIELHGLETPKAAPGVMRCGREDQEGRCTNPAQWQMYFRVFHIGQAKNAMSTRLLMNLHLCNKCKKKVKPEDFTRDRTFKADVTKEMANMQLPMPDWKRLQVEFLPMINNQPIDPELFFKDANV